jgi:hypothetical protein
VISHADGLPYALRRFEGVRTTAKIVQDALGKGAITPLPRTMISTVISHTLGESTPNILWHCGSRCV